MKEIEYRVGKAQHYYQLLAEIEISEQWQWCVQIGLWETSGWINDSKNEGDCRHGSQYELLGIVVPGHRGFFEK